MTCLLHISDLHFGAEDREALDWFALQAELHEPDSIVVTGDVTQRALPHQFEAAAEYLDALPAPVTIKYGNHDLPYFNLIERFLTPYKRMEKLKDKVERHIDLDNCVIVPLKTTARAQWRFNWSHGNVNDDSLDKTLRRLRLAPENKRKLVACHHPLIDTEEYNLKGSTRGGREALHAIAEAGAEAVLSGHVHTPFDLVVDAGGRPIRLIGAGTLSDRLRGHRPSYNEIKVAPDTIEVVHHIHD
ncbi:metallophosphoesterase family protein [Sphingomicrobium marinum]|uniref:metallophosphoesterase family protein n=1 Tax=Sphingomicrobium marinum TaxID=1227950 RepID=UPI0022406394|nr:metallophosphoesterase [Sphingomicrobium marinum]